MYKNDKMTSYPGYGWVISKSDRKNKVVAHNGSNVIYFADFVRFIDEDVVVIYITNAFLEICAVGVIISNLNH